jgi:hypothetical protein
LSIKGPIGLGIGSAKRQLANIFEMFLPFELQGWIAFRRDSMMRAREQSEDCPSLK